VPRPCVFLDRDGVINQKIEGGYVRSWSEFKLLPNISDWIRLFNALDHLVIVVTNQRGVALGQMTIQDVEAIHDKMLQELESQGAHIDDIFICPHAKDACDCRKPLPGLVLQAQQEYDIDLSRSLLIGDSDSDRQLARACGIRFLRAENGRLIAGSL
jgi:D-glycero-D-manno-heptose 1,7-bisphosphate phosphatase